MKTSRRKRVSYFVIACILTLVTTFPAKVDATFVYGPIADPILSASFSADFAALTAHRTIAGFEVNALKLAGAGLTLDLSDILFGATDALLDPALIDQGDLGTGIVSAAVDPGFFPALVSGAVEILATLTDTADGLFAIDFLSLTIDTGGGTVTALIDANNGYGIGLPDGVALPAQLPISIPIDATGTGFDEAISSISFQPKIAGPPTLALLGASALSFISYAWLRRAIRRR